mmetsp:Transcript_23565/g.41703  ORF Transcript_23565/g.41703 Transcript_23565/m.41703 type:complete len:310 (-) Transcript_23565:198-1127(-)
MSGSSSGGGLRSRPTIITPLRRPDSHSSRIPGDALLSAASPIDPSNGGELLSDQSARSLISQRVAMRIVFNFRQVLLVFLAVLCILSFVVLGWVLVEFAKHEKDPCDVPLSLYVKVWVVLWLFGVWKKEVHKCLLRWHPTDAPPPLRVRILDVVHISVVHVWVAMGIYWVSSSKECSKTAPELFLAVKWWVHLQAVVLLTGSLAILASRCLVQWLQRRSRYPIGVDAALIVARTMDEVKFDTAVHRDLLDEKGEVESCSVCQEPFDNKKIIRRTPCGHLFHDACLVAWYQRKPTCPLCRSNLLSTPEIV